MNKLKNSSNNVDNGQSCDHDVHENFHSSSLTLVDVFLHIVESILKHDIIRALMLGKTINESVTSPSINTKDSPDHNDKEKELNTSSHHEDLIECLLRKGFLLEHEDHRKFKESKNEHPNHSNVEGFNPSDHSVSLIVNEWHLLWGYEFVSVWKFILSMNGVEIFLGLFLTDGWNVLP